SPRAIGDRVLLTAMSTGGPGYSPIVYLYPPGGGNYATSTAGRLDFQLNASGTWTAVVQDLYLLNTGTFEVSFLDLTAGPLTTGSDTDGGPIASGSIASGTISGPGDFDAFTFSGTIGDHVLLAGLTTGGILNTNISVYPPGGGASITGTSADRLDVTLTATGTWTIVVEDYSNAAAGTYTLSLLDLSGTLTSAGDPDGGPIASNQILTGTTNAIGDFDAYTFSGVNGNRVVLTTLATSGTPYAAEIYLYPPGGGNYITASTGRMDTQLDASGTWTVVVQDQYLSHTG